MEKEEKITPEMLAAGAVVFDEWFGRDEHSEGLLEMPSDASIASLVQGVFEAMASCSRKS